MVDSSQTLEVWNHAFSFHVIYIWTRTQETPIRIFFRNIIVRLYVVGSRNKQDCAGPFPLEFIVKLERGRERYK